MIIGEVLLSHTVVLAAVQLGMAGINLEGVGMVEKWTRVMVGMVSMMVMVVTGEAMVKVLPVSMVALVDMDMDMGMVRPCTEVLDMELVVMAFPVLMSVLLDMVVVKDMEELAAAVMTMVKDMRGVAVL